MLRVSCAWLRRARNWTCPSAAPPPQKKRRKKKIKRKKKKREGEKNTVGWWPALVQWQRAPVVRGGGPGSCPGVGVDIQHAWFVELFVAWTGWAALHVGGRGWPGLAGAGLGLPGLAGAGRAWPGLAGPGRGWPGRNDDIVKLVSARSRQGGGVQSWD